MAGVHAPAEEPVNFLSLIVLSAIVGAFGIVIYLVLFKKEKEEEKSEELSEKNSDNKKKSETEDEQKSKQKQQQQTKKKPVKEANTSHPLLLAALKGHTGPVLNIDFSSNGKFLGSVSEDRTARLWNVKDIQQKEHKYSRVNVAYDHATAISFSPDSKAFVVSLGLAKTVRIYKIHKTKTDSGSSSLSITSEYDFPVEHKVEIFSVGVASNGKYIMTASKDTQITIWSLKGDVYEKIDSLLIYNTQVSISPCGNLVAACGFTSDVKMWHIGFNKAGEFTQVSKGLELKGHSAGVLSFSFTNDSTRMASVSKDKTWKIWNIDVNYLKGQQAYLLHTGQYNGIEDDISTHIALSHDYFTVAIATGQNISLYNANTQELGESLEHVHQGRITCLRWHSESRQLVSAGGSDRSVKVWHNPVGVKANLEDLKEKLPKAKGDSMKERIQQQIEECRKKILHKTLTLKIRTYLKSFES